MFLLIFDILYLILSNLLHPIGPNTSHKLPCVYLLPPCTMQPFRSKLEVNGQCCTCGRAFDQPSTYNKHKWTCSKTKRWLSSTLELAREKWLGTSAKQQWVELVEPLFNPEHYMPGLAHVWETAKVCNNSQILVTYWLNQPNIQPSAPVHLDSVDDSHMSMVKHQPWTQRLNRHHPLCYWDTPSQPTPPSHK
jgi:hypothetical protein